MLDMINTRISEVRPGQTLPGQAPDEAGVPLTLVKLEDGSTGFEPSKDGGEFGGVSYLRQSPAKYNTICVDEVIGASGVVELPRLPLAGQISFYIEGTIVPAANIAVDSAAPDAVGKVNIDGFNLYFHAGDVGKALKVLFKYELTVSEAKELSGDGPIGGHASVQYDGVQRIVKGTVGTTNFDASVDWLSFTGFHPAVGANGFTIPDGTNKAITSVTIKSLPTGDDGVLVVELN